MIEFAKRNKILGFLLSVILLILGYPLASLLEHHNLVFGLSMVVLVAGIYAISHRGWTLVVGTLLGILAVILDVLDTASSGIDTLTIIRIITVIVFFAFLAVVIIFEVVSQKKITAEMIYGSIAGYLLIGMMGGAIFILMEILEPGSFNVDLVDHDSGFAFMYFSFVTLTTLGYGDIIPTATHSKAFAVVHSVIGQFYLTVLIATLVGKFIIQPKPASRSSSKTKK